MIQCPPLDKKVKIVITKTIMMQLTNFLCTVKAVIPNRGAAAHKGALRRC